MNIQNRNRMSRLHCSIKRGVLMQLSIFEIEVIPFEVSDQVRIVIPDYKRGDPESFYYLSDFERKRGEVLKVVHAPSLQYHVDFDGRTAIVYHDEIKRW